MKLKALLLALFVAGLTTSLAVAGPPPGKGGPPPGKGKKGDPTTAVSTTGATTTSASAPVAGAKPDKGKVVLCHKTGSKKNPWVKITVAAQAADARMNKGDVKPDASGNCGSAPAPVAPATTTVATTTAATTTAPTTTAATTTVATTTVAATTTSTTTR